MSVFFSKPHNRLTRYAGWTGLSRKQVVDGAKAGLQTLREPTIDYVDENLRLLYTLFAQMGEAEPPPYGALYDASNAIAGTAALFGFDALGTGAFSLCELLAHLEEQKTWNAPVVRVYLDGFSIMRQFKPETASDEATLILDNLARLLSHITTLGARR